MEEKVYGIDPQMKFVGLSLAATSSVQLALQQARFFEYERRTTLRNREWLPGPSVRWVASKPDSLPQKASHSSTA
jgi:hypothetical protein